MLEHPPSRGLWITHVLGGPQPLGHRGAKAIALEHPWDEPLYVAALAVSATPSANNLLVMVELSGGNRAAMATAIVGKLRSAVGTQQELNSLLSCQPVSPSRERRSS